MGLAIYLFSNVVAIKNSGLNCRVGSNPTSPAKLGKYYQCKTYN